MASQYRKFVQQFRVFIGECIARRPIDEMETSPYDEINQRQVTLAAGSIGCLPPPPAIFRLNSDCLRELFEWLPIEDLLAFGKTCTWLSQNVGDWLSGKPLRLLNSWTDNSLYTADIPTWEIETNCFSQIISNITVFYRSSLNIHSVNLSRYPSLKSIEFVKIKISPIEIECLREILCQIEAIKLVDCKIGADALEAVLSACTHMEYLSVIRERDEKKRSKRIIGTNNSWLRKRYLKLKHFELMSGSFYVRKIKQLPQFFDLNSNIRSFSTDAHCLLKNADYLLQANVKFNVFSITLSIDHDYVRKSIQLLNQLYEHQFYEQLYVKYSVYILQEDVDLLATLKNLVRFVMHFCWLESSIILPDLTELEQLFISSADHITNWAVLPNNLLNLHRVGCKFASADDLFAFIRRSPKLKIIIVLALSPGIHFNLDTKVIDLVALNNERQKLKEAQKITIYLSEKIYLATKWAYKETNFSLIQLKSSFYMHRKDFPIGRH